MQGATAPYRLMFVSSISPPHAAPIGADRTRSIGKRRDGTSGTADDDGNESAEFEAGNGEQGQQGRSDPEPHHNFHLVLSLEQEVVMQGTAQDEPPAS